MKLFADLRLKMFLLRPVFCLFILGSVIEILAMVSFSTPCLGNKLSLKNVLFLYKSQKADTGITSVAMETEQRTYMSKICFSRLYDI